VFGTSVDPYRADITDFTVATLPEMNMCGLKCATRFRLDRQIDLPWTREFFSCLPGKPTPIIGHMPAYEVRKLQTQISYFQQKFAEWQAARAAASEGGDDEGEGGDETKDDS
jgi:hypothetical protein